MCWYSCPKKGFLGAGQVIQAQNFQEVFGLLMPSVHAIIGLTTLNKEKEIFVCIFAMTMVL